MQMLNRQVVKSESATIKVLDIDITPYIFIYVLQF